MGGYCSGEALRRVNMMSNRPRLGYDFQKTTFRSDRFGEVLFTRKREQQYNFMMSINHDGALEQISVDMVVLRELVDCILFPNYDLRFQNKTIIDIFDMDDHSQVLVEAVHRKTGQPYSVKFYPFRSYNDHLFKKGLYEVFMHGLVGNFAKGVVNLMDYFVVDRSQEKALVFVYEPVETSLANIIEYRNHAQQPWSDAEQQYIMHSILIGYDSLNRKNIYHRDLRPSRIFYSKYKKEYLIGNLEEARVVMAVDLQKDALLTPRGVPFFNSEKVNEILRRNDRVGHYNALQNDYIFLKKLMFYISNTSYEDNHDSVSNVVLRGIYDRLLTLQPIQGVLAPIRHIDFKIEQSGIAQAVNAHLADTNAKVNKVLLLQSLYYMHHNEQYSRLAHQQIEENIELGRPLLNAEIFYRLGEYYASSGANSEDYFINALKLFIRRSIYNRKLGFIGRSVECLRQAKKCHDFILDLNYKIMYLGEMAVVKANMGLIPEANAIMQQAMTQAATRGIPPLQELDLLLNKGEVCIFSNDVDNCQRHMKFGLSLCEDREYFNDLRQQGEYKARFLTLMGISYVGESTGKDTFIVQQTGIVDNRLKHLNKAESFLLSALEISELSPTKNIEMATIVYYLGLIHQLRGDFYQAKKSFVRALEFRVSYKEEISPPLIAQVFYKVATCHRLLNELTEAERHYRSALKILSVVPNLREEALICHAYLAITMIRQGRVEDGTIQFNLAQQGFGGQMPPQIMMQMQQAQAQGQPLAAQQTVFRTTHKLPPGVFSSQQLNTTVPMTGSITQQTIIQEIVPSGMGAGVMMPQPGVGQSLANMMATGFQPLPPTTSTVTEVIQMPGGMGGFGAPPMQGGMGNFPGLPGGPGPAGFQGGPGLAQIGGMAQSLSGAGNPMNPFPRMNPGMMESRVLPAPNIGLTESAIGTGASRMLQQTQMQQQPMGYLTQVVEETYEPNPAFRFNQSPPPSQMFNQAPPPPLPPPDFTQGSFGAPPSRMYQDQVFNEPPSRFGAPPPRTQLYHDLPRESEIRGMSTMPPPLNSPFDEVPVPQPPAGFFQSMMGVTPGTQQGLIGMSGGQSGIRQTEIDVYQDRDASGTHRNVVIHVPNQSGIGGGSNNDIVINLGNNPNQPVSIVSGTGSNPTSRSRVGQDLGYPQPQQMSNLYQGNSGGVFGMSSPEPSTRNLVPLNSNGAIASNSLIRVPVP